MSEDDRQHQMDFILAQQAAFSSEMVELRQGLAELKEVQTRQSENIDKLVTLVRGFAEAVEINRQETHESIDNLIIANEVTRDLADKAARLAISASQRLTAHEKQPHDATS